MRKNRVRFGALFVDVITKNEVLNFANAILQENKRHNNPAVIVTVNAQFIYLAAKQPRFAKFINNAYLSIADGMSLVYGSCLLKKPLPERITGIDLSNDLCKLLNQTGGSVYLLGGKPGAASFTAQMLQAHYPQLCIAGANCPPQGFEKLFHAADAVLKMIQNAKPDLLLVGLGAPKQEYWIENNLCALPCKLVIGVGGTFDILSGQVQRAPVWMQKCGLEWFFRLCVEPSRLWKRYLICNSYFIWIILTQFFAHIINDKTKKKVEVAR
jgi:N-acetylglucosaminyldiphosphoundecaprenol N-acetyl-beta-D-mannosaminyltransferase